jgi:hypothetical protein
MDWKPLLILLFLVGSLSATLYPVRAEAPPAFDEPWGPERPGGEFMFVGPIQPGYGFVAYFEDRYGIRRTDVYEDEMPIILVITLPPGLRNSWASCIQYYPPNYAIRSFLFRNINLGPSGTYRIGPFYQAPGEPYGRYAFRIGVLSVDAAGNLYWDEAVTFLELREKIVTITTTQTVTQTITGLTIITVTVPTEKTAIIERTVTQPTIITVKEPTFITFEKTLTQTTTTTVTTQVLEATIPTIVSIVSIIAVALVLALFMRTFRKKQTG